MNGQSAPDLEDRVYEALLKEYQRRIRDQVVDSPEGHVRAFTKVVIAELDSETDPGMV